MKCWSPRAARVRGCPAVLFINTTRTLHPPCSARHLLRPVTTWRCWPFPTPDLKRPNFQARSPMTRSYQSCRLRPRPGESWVGSEMAVLREADAAGVPVLEVCFGGQLLAQAHGGRSTNPVPEIGVPGHLRSPRVVPEGPGSNGIPIAGRYPPMRSRSLTTATPHSPSFCDGRWQCSSIPNSTATSWSSGSRIIPRRNSTTRRWTPKPCVSTPGACKTAPPVGCVSVVAGFLGEVAGGSTLAGRPS